MTEKKKKNKRQLSSFSVLFIILIVLGIVTVLLNGQPFIPGEIDGKVVDHMVGAKLSGITMALFNGFRDAIEVNIFILVLGGFLNIATQAGALEAGIQSVVEKLKGNELRIIPILMILFSIDGSTYGVAEETIPFYGLLSATMVTAGSDTFVAVGTVLLGMGSGAIGSTVSPFSTGVAIDALRGTDIQPNIGIILIVGTVLWAASTSYSIFIVIRYAKKVKADKSSTVLSLQEQEDMEKTCGQTASKEMPFTNRHKKILMVFALCFVVMIVSLIPWNDFGVTTFKGWTSVLTGNDFGDWYFDGLAMWLFLLGVIAALIGRLTRKETIEAFINGVKDILSVVLIIVVVRRASVLMSKTCLGSFILGKATGLLQELSPVLFVTGASVSYLGLSFLILSTSSLVYVSIPVMGALVKNIGLSPKVVVMIFASGYGLVNLITPISGVVMGGLETSEIQYAIRIKLIAKPMIVSGLINLIILISAILLFS